MRNSLLKDNDDAEDAVALNPDSNDNEDDDDDDDGDTVHVDGTDATSPSASGSSLDLRFSHGLSSARDSRSSMGSVLSARISGFTKRLSGLGSSRLSAASRNSATRISAVSRASSQENWENVDLE